MKVREFGTTPAGCVCNVLAVLSDGEESRRATFRAAVDLAERANARLTLVKTCEQGRSYVWVAPFAVGAAYLPPELASPDEAAQLLSRLAADVPESIPVTMLVLTSDAQGSLLRLLRERHFGAVVIDRSQLTQWRRVRRALWREQLQTVLIRGECGPEEAGGLAAQPSVRELDLSPVDVAQVPQAPHRRGGALRHWGSRRLAGAGGEH